MRLKLVFGGLLAAVGIAGQGALPAFADLSFTTTAGWRFMDVPLYHQVHGLDCEAAALQMALAYQGIGISQDSILNAMGIDRRLPTRDAGGFHWGDPYDAFVGNPDGAERLYTGYGVYYPPTVSAAQRFGGSVRQSGEGIAPSTIYQALLDGNPVITWIAFDWKFHQVTHYVAFDGDTVQFGSPYEHTVTLAGVTSDWVLVNNPWFGRQWISKATFEAAYATFNNMAIIFNGPGGASSVPTASTTVAGTMPVPSDTYHPVPAARIADTRNGTGGVPQAPLRPGSTLDVQVAGAGGVPSTGASSVVLNVTVADTTGSSFLTVFPSGAARPATSNLNWDPGQLVPNLVQVPLGANGKVTAYNLSGSADLIVDVAGWFGPPATPSGTDGLFNGLTPARLLDTRDGTGGRSSPLGQGQVMNLQVAGRGGVPGGGAAAVVLNLTATNPTASGYVTVFAAGAARPATSNLNFTPGALVSNRVVVPLGSGGQISLWNFAGNVGLIVDVNGWFTDSSGTGHGSRFVTIGPQRVLDTRGGFGAMPQGGTATTQVADPAQIGISAVVLNVTAIYPRASGFVELWPAGSGRPVASDVNFPPWRIVPNLATVKLGASASFDTYNLAGSTDVALDLVGYYGPLQ